MSSILENGNNKTKCQKFTPGFLVEMMLDLIGYKTSLMGKTILENSFGSGNILKAIIKRYIEDAISVNYKKSDISKGLEQDVHGIELDGELYTSCIHELNTIVENYGLPPVNWSLYNSNALFFEFKTKFDFVIGNPPYISYREMDKESRIAIKKKYDSCSIGKFDYCYAFIELGLTLLKPTGKLVQLIPNNIYKNVFAQKLREMLVDKIAIIRDYPNQKLFDKALTSISIFVYDKNCTAESIDYCNMTTKQHKEILRKSLGSKWMFEDHVEETGDSIRFGDLFNASVTIATLCNKAFVVDQTCIDAERLETEIIRKAVSPKSLRYKKNKFIIFPYKYGHNGLERYSAKEIQNYPCVVKHLQQYSDELEKRNSDSNALWFEYGRSQALAHLNDEKVLLSTVITDKVEVYKVDALTIPYSGIYITVKNTQYSLNDAITILQSKDFFEYVQKIGISVSGKSVRITCKDINNYRFLRR